MLIVKVTGKNSMRNLKSKVLMASNWLDGYEISDWLCRVLWPHVKLCAMRSNMEQTMFGQFKGEQCMQLLTKYCILQYATKIWCIV